MKLGNTFLIILITVIFIIGYAFFIKTSYFHRLSSWVETNRLSFIVYLLVWKIVATVWPPLTGGLVTLGSIPLIGWEAAYFVDFSGSLIAGVIDYHLGRKYGLWILNKLFDESVVRKIQKVKVKENKEIETVFLYRLFLGMSLLEGVYYSAGFLRITFRNFLIGAALSHIAIGVPTFYFIRSVFDTKNIIFTVVLLVIGIPIIYLLRKRHFEF